MGAEDHRQKAGKGPVTVAIVTVSDTRTPETDQNRHYIEARMKELGHNIAAYRLIKDEPDQVAVVLTELADLPGVAQSAEGRVARAHRLLEFGARILLPRGARMLFLPQRPYLPIGRLKQQAGQLAEAAGEEREAEDPQGARHAGGIFPELLGPGTREMGHFGTKSGAI